MSVAHVDPGELRYAITVTTPRRTKDGNGHYRETREAIRGRAGVRSARGEDRVEDGAARSIDTVQFIVRWELRQRITRDSAIEFRGAQYRVDWMDETPWAGRYARIRAVSRDQGEE